MRVVLVGNKTDAVCEINSLHEKAEVKTGIAGPFLDSKSKLRASQMNKTTSIRGLKKAPIRLDEELEAVRFASEDH